MPRQSPFAHSRSIVASATVTTSSNSGDLFNTGNALLPCDAMTLVLDVTNLGGNTAAELFVYIDSSPDNGTTWYPSYTFTQVTASTGIQKVEMRPIGIGPTESASVTNFGLTINTTTVGQVNTIILPHHRVRWRFVDSLLNPTATFAVWQYATPFGTYGA